MGRKKRSSKKNNEEVKRADYREIVKDNEDFVKYYKAQKICPDDEWEVMLNALRSSLPTAFRITSFPKIESTSLSSVVENTLLNQIITSANEESKPYCLPWYPDRLAWQIEITRNDIRKSEIYSKLHKFLICETDDGGISRQEVVSMIPPLLLDIQPHHKILDMCAAPGSKTAQLIELLHSESDDVIPSGLLVANDIDNKRCYMLVHQAKRLNSPSCVITNHDAAIMPNMWLTDADGKDYAMKYDRVLCDVPCTGDGTLRKNPDIWFKWNTSNGNNLHGVQIRILKRGLELLNIDGRLVYSTCSLNPVENEAVLHRLLTEAKGAVELVDTSNMLPGLKYKPGINQWWPASKDVVCYNSFEEVPEKWHTIVRPPMFPPDEKMAAGFHLERCMRILPHQQNTGGFFVAVLKKIKSLPWEAEIDTEKDVVKAPLRKKKKLGYKEDPFVFLNEDDPVWISIKEFYDISESKLLPTCLLTRCATGKKKILYLVSPIVKNLIENNQHRVKIINSGVKTFVRCDNKSMHCCFRLAQEGLLSIEKFLGKKRRISINRDDIVKILKNNRPANPLNISQLQASVQDRLNEIESGSCMLEIDDKELPIKLVGWKGTKTIRAYITIVHCVHYLRIFGQDVSDFDVNKDKKQKENGMNDKLEIETNNE